MKATGSFRKRAVYNEFLECYEHKCGYCEIGIVRKGNMTLDHFIPASKNGGNRYTNFVPACYDCNHDKDNLDAVEWMKGKGHNVFRLFYKMNKVYNISFENGKQQFFNCKLNPYSPLSFFWKYLDTQWKWIEYAFDHLTPEEWSALNE